MDSEPIEIAEARASIAHARRVVVLTGAGISASCGLPTYRGPGGLWERDPELARAMTAGVAPERLWRALAPLRAALAAAEPSPAHRALVPFAAELARRGGALVIITQNIDGLHQRAGSTGVVDLHGSLLRSRCSARACALAPFVDLTAPADPPPCPQCGAPLRPDITLFEETIGVGEDMASRRALRECDLFLAIGTSGSVWPASSFVRAAAYAGARTLFVNLQPLDARAPAYDLNLLGPADAIVPALLAPA